MATNSHTNKDLHSFIIICFPLDGQSAEDDSQALSPQESVNFIKLFKPNSVLIRRTNTTVFIPFIEVDIGALLFETFSKTRKKHIAAFTESYIGVNFRQNVAFCCHSNLDYFIHLLVTKYVPKRVCYSVRCEEIINFTDWTSENVKDCEGTKVEIADELSEPVISVKKEWRAVHLVVKHKNHENFQSRFKKKRYLAEIQSDEVLSEVKAYFENDPVTQYRKRKLRPSVCKDKKSESKEIETDQERDAVSVSNTSRGSKVGKDFKSPKVPRCKKQKRKTDTEYRKSCPAFSSFEIFMDIEVDKGEIFLDPENFEKPAGQEKDVSIKQFYEKDGDLRLEVRKDLREITNLPLRRYPVRRQDVIVFPGGRKKKNERPTERRPQQRSQAQDQSFHAQPTEDDPVPDSLFTLTRDRYALPSQPEQRNLQHLLSSFTPRVEPISASTQQLRRLASRPRHQQYADENARRDSFNDWPSNTGQNPENMVTNGFFYTGRVDLIRCFMCGIGLKDWSSDDEPLFEHVRHSPDCPFLYTFLGQDVLDAYKAALLPGRAQPTHARDDSLGLHDLDIEPIKDLVNKISGESLEGASNISEGTPIAPAEGTPAPRNREYEDLRRRIESFSEWPRNVTQTPRQLAEAGFFHTGEADTVRCFHCDGGLRRWDPRDDPWIEHTRWFPHCPYVRQIKGLEYVELVQRAIRESAGEDDDEPMGYGDTVGAMANLTVQPPASNEPQEPAVTTQTILDMGYTREALAEAMKKAEERGMVNYTPQDLLEILLEMGSSGQLAPPEPRPQGTQESQGATSGAAEDDPLFVTIENKSLRKVLKCSECKIRDKNILFLPCTHHSLCEECAEKATKCPVCDSEINRKVKTYMS